MTIRMSIRLRSYLILALIAAPILVLVLSGILAASSNETVVTRLYANALLPSMSLKTVSDGYAKAGAVAAMRVRTGDLSWEEGEAWVRRLRETLQPAWTDYASQAGGQAGQPLMREAQVRIAGADAALDQLVDILEGRDAAGLVTYISRSVPSSINPLLSTFEQLTHAQDQAGKDLYASAKNAMHVQELALAGIMVIIVLGVIGAVLIIRRRVIRPLMDMTAAISAVTVGDCDRGVPDGHRREDIGVVAEAFVRFSDNARRVKELALELFEARDRAEAAIGARVLFLTVLSREIPTPMSGVIALVEELDQTELTEHQRSLSMTIRQSATALLAVINDILDVPLIETDRLAIERVPFSLVEVVEGTAEMAGPPACERGLVLVVDLDPTLPDRLAGDPYRVSQVLRNLLSNAMAVTEAGSITLSVSKVANGFRFSVTDTGIGLTEAEQSRVFLPSVHPELATGREAGGTGLGLPVCRRLCRRMGGELGVISAPGQGVTFWFELPLDVIEFEPVVPETLISDARVVAVGVPAVAVMALAKLLAVAGVTDVTWVEAGAGPLPETRPGVAVPVVLLYASNADREVIDLGHRLARLGRVILMTSRVPLSVLAEADLAGLFAVLTLPVRRRWLWSTIAAALGRASLDPQTVGGEGVWCPPSDDEARAVGALVLVAEDNPTLQVVIGRLLTRLGYAHRIVSDGVEALAELERPGCGLLLADCHMPEMDGFGLAAAIRAAEAGGRTRLPILALTVDALAETIRQCLDAGMDGTLTKPVDRQVLARTLERLLPQALELRREPKAISPPALPPAPGLTPEPVCPVVDPEILDLGRLRELFGSFGADACAFLSLVVDGIQALLDGIKNALDRDDDFKARDAVNALKCAAVSIGALRLVRLVADLQDCVEAGDLHKARLMASLLRPTHEELVTATAGLRRWGDDDTIAGDRGSDSGE